MLSLNKVKKGLFVKINRELFLVLRAEHSKMGRAGAVLRTKLKNLVSGATITKTFQGQEKIEEAELERKKANFLYSTNKNLNFMDKETFEEISLSKNQVGKKAQFLKEGQELTILFHKETPINIELSRTVTLKIAEAPPNVRGDTTGAARKEVTTEAGTKVIVPVFIKKGDLIKIDSESGEYKERA